MSVNDSASSFEIERKLLLTWTFRSFRQLQNLRPNNCPSESLPFHTGEGPAGKYLMHAEYEFGLPRLGVIDVYQARWAFAKVHFHAQYFAALSIRHKFVGGELPPVETHSSVCLSTQAGVILRKSSKYDAQANFKRLLPTCQIPSVHRRNAVTGAIDPKGSTACLYISGGSKIIM